MAVSTTIKIEGLEKLQGRFRAFGRDLDKNLNMAIEKSVFDLENNVKPITPIDTGRLRSSFRRSLSNLKGELQNFAPYAVYVHEGTSRWPLSFPPKNTSTVRQFFVKGAEKSKKKIEANFNAAINKSVRKMGGKI